MFKRLVSVLFATATLAMLAPPVAAQDLMSRPITVLVPYAPGNTDAIIRMAGQKITDTGGPRFIIENKPGGGGAVAAAALKEARPDGFTLMAIDIGTHATTPVLNPVNYDPVKDVAPITTLWSAYNALIVPGQAPVRSVKDLIDLAKRKPGGVDNATQGIGTGAHILGALFAKAAGVPVTQVHYQGGGPARTDLLAGRVDMLFTGYIGIKDSIAAGQLRALGIAGPSRLEAAPELPTLAEQGLPPVVLEIWYGIGAPAGTDPAIVNRLNTLFAQAMASAEMRKFAVEQGIDGKTRSPADFTALIQRDLAMMTGMVKDLKVDSK